MQRRGAAIFVAVFLVLGGASLSLVVTAEAPHFDVKGKTLEKGDTFTVSGTQYTVTKVEATEASGGGGHGGGGGGITYTAAFQWTNESARYTENWQNNTTVQFDGKTWRLLVHEGDDPSSFTLREDINETAILKDDPNADDQMVTHDGKQYVVVRENGNETLVPYDEYFPDPETREYQEGDTVQYQGNETTFTTVTTSGVTLEWFAPKTNTVEVGQEGNVTLGGTTYFAYFPSHDAKKVIISTNFEALHAYNAELKEYHEQKNGLWGVTIMSGLSAFLVLGMAFMPSRY